MLKVRTSKKTGKSGSKIVAHLAEEVTVGVPVVQSAIGTPGPTGNDVDRQEKHFGGAGESGSEVCAQSTDANRVASIMALIQDEQTCLTLITKEDAQVLMTVLKDSNQGFVPVHFCREMDEEDLGSVICNFETSETWTPPMQPISEIMECWGTDKDADCTVHQQIKIDGSECVLQYPRNLSDVACSDAVMDLNSGEWIRATYRETRAEYDIWERVLVGVSFIGAMSEPDKDTRSD